MTEIDQLLAAATDKKSFSVLDTLAGRSYPEDTVTVHTNTADAYLVKLLEDQAADIPAEDKEQLDALDQAVAEARQRVKDSALTFHLKGFPPKVSKNIQLEAQGLFPPDADGNVPEGIVPWIDHKCLIESIQKVVDTEGAEDTHRWTHEELTVLEGLMPDEEYERLKMAMAGLSFATAYFEGVVDADF